MTLKELLDINVNDEQLDVLEIQCKAVLGEMQFFLYKYNAPENVQADLRKEIALFTEYVKSRCETYKDNWRGCPVDAIVVNAYCDELEKAFELTGLSKAFEKKDDKGRPMISNKDFTFETNADFNLAISVRGHDYKGREEHRVIPYNIFDDTFTNLYQDALADVICDHYNAFDKKAIVVNETKYGESGDDLYKFITSDQESDTFPKMDEFMKKSKTAVKEHE